MRFKKEMNFVVFVVVVASTWRKRVRVRLPAPARIDFSTLCERGGDFSDSLLFVAVRGNAVSRCYF